MIGRADGDIQFISAISAVVVTVKHTMPVYTSRIRLVVPDAVKLPVGARASHLIFTIGAVVVTVTNTMLRHTRASIVTSQQSQRPVNTSKLHS